jgi:hypothetical protein
MSLPILCEGWDLLPMLLPPVDTTGGYIFPRYLPKIDDVEL